MNVNWMVKVCEHCGKVFYTKFKFQKYCKPCAKEVNRLKRKEWWDEHRKVDGMIVEKRPSRDYSRLHRVMRMADERGISYGQMKAVLRGELKL